MVSIAVVNQDAELAALAAQLSLPLITDTQIDYELLLIKHEGKLSILWQQPKQQTLLNVDFLHGALAHRQRQHLRGEIIAKAVGIKGDYRPIVVDATAGLGRDAFILASLGCEVTLIEQHAVIAALLQDGLQRLQAEKPLPMHFIAGNAIDVLAKLTQKPEVTYLDPMFPPRPNSALVKKDMQILQLLTHSQKQEEATLLSTALNTAIKRVVVKRPTYAAPLAGIQPNFSIATKAHRFDIYTQSTG
jgi:16S rRNA (guanine1516-N2)-methyltransferase